MYQYDVRCSHLFFGNVPAWCGLVQRAFEAFHKLHWILGERKQLIRHPFWLPTLLLASPLLRHVEWCLTRPWRVMAVGQYAFTAKL